MKNIKLVIEYDGTNYAGWQIQKNASSIQETIETGLWKITGENVKLTGSGRTDSCVHARGQAANFYTRSHIPADRFSYALNAVLPKDIRIRSSQEMNSDFHARYSALAKKYRYSMYVDPHGPAINRNYFYHVRENIDMNLMKEASRLIEGTHDFRGFMASGSSVENTVRTIYQAHFLEQYPYLYFDIKGNGFLYNMVRIIIGTLILIGAKRLDPVIIKDIIESKDRKKAGPTAPAHGLCLEEVFY